MKYKFYLIDASSVLYPDASDLPPALSGLCVFSNEAAAFQVAVRCENQGGESGSTSEIVTELDSPISRYITVYTVEETAATRIGYDFGDDWMDRSGRGIYPDRLERLERGMFTAVTGYYRTLFFNVNERLDTVQSGTYPIRISFFTSGVTWNGERTEREKLGEVTLTVTFLEEILPKQSIITTNWMHYDCMAVLSGTKPWSDAYFDVVRSYIELAVQNGQNAVFVPAFTPPLDTPVGEERMTTQLIKIEKLGDKYEFDLSLLDRFIRMAHDCGAEYFEHSHLFTQWGAAHAPKIIVREKNVERKLFGWETAGDDPEYRRFLHEYLMTLKTYIVENGLKERFFFHVSDEPSEKWLDTYKSAADFVHTELAGFNSGDALGEYRFYKEGLVQTPIVSTDCIESFIGKSERLWLYFTGLQSKEYMSNRVIGMPLARCRVLGVQLYWYGFDGFLHWGFNAHHNRLSRRIFDPRISPDMGGDFPAGTSYLVYPGKDGAAPSLRLTAFRDAMQDYRIFKLMETKCGRESVLALIREYIPNIGLKCRVSADELTALRKAAIHAIIS